MKKTAVSNKFEDFEKYLQKRVRSGVKNVSKLCLEIKDLGYTGSYASLNRFLRPRLKKSKSGTYKISKRFETKPGEQAQVDWGSFGKIFIDGREERLYAFVYILGYSRAMFVQFTVRQNLQTFLKSHINAFRYLGIPKSIVYDNVKTVILSRNKVFGGTRMHFNPGFLDFSQFYGFRIEVCPPYWPRAKGKVESAVKFVRNNFMQGLKFKKDFGSLEQLNEKAQKWLEKTANVRVHATTGESPKERWKKEKPVLRYSGNLTDYNTAPFLVRNSTKDATVQYNHNHYSVPKTFARRKLFIREVNKNGATYLHIYQQDKLVAEHKISLEKNKWIIDEKHIFSGAINKNLANKRFVYKNNRNVEITARPLSYYDKFISN